MKKNIVASLATIMREQEASPSASEIQINSSLEDGQLAREVALEYDEDLALELQNIERSALLHSHPRNFDVVESEYINMNQNSVAEDEGYYDSDEFGDYQSTPKVKYAAPKNIRTGENATEFKTYSTRNTGVKEFKKQKKFIAKQYKSAVNVFQIKQEDSDYGRIISPNLNKVYCFWDGLTRKAHVLKKVKMLRGLTDGQLVLVKIRRYQESVVDIIHAYNSQEEAALFEMGEIVTRDPLEHLPSEVIRIVLEHMESQYAMDMLRQVSKSWNIMAKEHSPAKYLPRKIQFERRVKEIEWGELSKYHWQLYVGKIRPHLVSSEHCKFFWASSFYHLKNACDLQGQVLSIAENVWNQYAPEHQRTALKQANNTEDRLFTYLKCYYLAYKDEQIRNFASLVLWSWIKLHERQDLSKLDVQTYFREFLVQSARRCVDTLISSLKVKLTTTPAYQLPAMRARINFLEERWKLLLEQPVVSMEDIDFTVESSSDDDSDDYFNEEYASGSDSDSGDLDSDVDD